MFVDTYLIEKQSKIEDYDLLSAQYDIMRQIDEKQGLRALIQIQTDAYPFVINKLYELLQKSQRGSIVVEYTNVYGVAYSYIPEESWEKQQFAYNVFFFHSPAILTKLHSHEMYRLREDIESGKKMAIYLDRK